MNKIKLTNELADIIIMKDREEYMRFWLKIVKTYGRNNFLEIQHLAQKEIEQWKSRNSHLIK